MYLLICKPKYFYFATFFVGIANKQKSCEVQSFVNLKIQKELIFHMGKCFLDANPKSEMYCN